MTFVIGTTKPNAHELDKEKLRLTHDDFKVRYKRYINCGVSQGSILVPGSLI